MPPSFRTMWPRSARGLALQACGIACCRLSAPETLRPYRRWRIGFRTAMRWGFIRWRSWARRNRIYRRWTPNWRSANPIRAWSPSGKSGWIILCPRCKAPRCASARRFSIGPNSNWHANMTCRSSCTCADRPTNCSNTCVNWCRLMAAGAASRMLSTAASSRRPNSSSSVSSLASAGP